VFSFYAAAAGAREVLCLEPEGQGGSIGMNEQFHRLQRLTGFHNVRLEHAMLQTFEPTPASFDVVLLHNSVNHLDEAMVPLLHRDGAAGGEDARDVYRSLFRRVADALVPAGHLVLTDCARDNLFPRLGLRLAADEIRTTLRTMELVQSARGAWLDVAGEPGGGLLLHGSFPAARAPEFITM
jgi:SAM-dependent methyltransferase